MLSSCRLMCHDPRPTMRKLINGIFEPKETAPRKAGARDHKNTLGRVRTGDGRLIKTSNIVFLIYHYRVYDRNDTGISVRICISCKKSRPHPAKTHADRNVFGSNFQPRLSPGVGRGRVPRLAPQSQIRTATFQVGGYALGGL